MLGLVGLGGAVLVGGGLVGGAGEVRTLVPTRLVYLTGTTELWPPRCGDPDTWAARLPVCVRLGGLGTTRGEVGATLWPGPSRDAIGELGDPPEKLRYPTTTSATAAAVPAANDRWSQLADRKGCSLLFPSQSLAPVNRALELCRMLPPEIS